MLGIVIKLWITVGLLAGVVTSLPSKYTDADHVHPAGERYPRAAGAAGGGGRILRDWNALAQEALQTALDRDAKKNTNTARNLVIFLGDGMGLPTVAAARKLRTQQEDGLELTDANLVFDNFPHVGLAKTYNIDKYVPDSAATGTAFLCGEKAPYSTLGVSQHAVYDNCSSVSGNELKSVLKWAMEEGKWTGVVTNTRITHATPAAAYASVANRDWEAAVPRDVEGWQACRDSADQLVNAEANQNIRVILGGGRKNFFNATEKDPTTGEPGQRTDGRNLIQEWLGRRNSTLEPRQYKFVTNKTDFDNVNVGQVDYLMGLFAMDHMDYNWDRADKGLDQPSLSSMVDTAVRLLRRGPEGFVLLVEGGRIDQGHHASNALLALNETLEFDQAVRAAIELTDNDDTLTVVTADHSHVFNMGGYPSMDNDLFGFDDARWQPSDGLPYTTLTYANGPGYQMHRVANASSTQPDSQRLNLTGVDTASRDFIQDSGIPLSQETHGGEDVAIYALGPLAHLFHGVHEQHYVAHVMMYAACIGTNRAHCDGELNGAVRPAAGSQSIAALLASSALLVVMFW